MAMVRRQSGIRKRRRRRMPRVYSKRFRLGPVASYQAARYSTRASGGELKFHDVIVNNLSADTNGLITDTLLTIPEGVGESQRVGRKIIIRQLQLYANATLLAVTDATNVSVDCRFILYLDSQTNGSAAAVADILESATVRSFRNLSNSGRFRILMDKRFGLSAQAGGAHALDSTHSFTVTRVFGLNKRLELPIEYDSSAATGALATMRSNNIGMLVLAEINSRVQFNTSFRFRYSDS